MEHNQNQKVSNTLKEKRYQRKLKNQAKYFSSLPQTLQTEQKAGINNLDDYLEEQSESSFDEEEMRQF